MALKTIFREKNGFFATLTKKTCLGAVLGGLKSAKKGHFCHEIFFRKSIFSPKDHDMAYKLAGPSEVPEISAKKIFMA